MNYWKKTRCLFVYYYSRNSKKKIPKALISVAANFNKSHLEGSKPHEPVQPIVVRRNETRPAVNIPWLAQELVLLPDCRRVLGILAQSALEDHLCALLGDAAG